jgi:dTDP-4-amino-4,6-dideoxygalactose transaminase
MYQIPRFIPTLRISELFWSAIANLRDKNKGRFVDLFAEKFAQYIGVRYAIFVPSARAGLVAILSSLKIPRGKEVIIPGLTHHIMPNIFRNFGLEPCFVDIDPDTYCIDVVKLEKAVNESTAAVFPVHLYGRACNMKAIIEIARRYRLLIIEDCAQSCGGTYSGNRLGSFGAASIFSFHPHKNLSVLGAGMVTTNSSDIARGVLNWTRQYKDMGGMELLKRLIYTAGVRLVTLRGVWRNIMVPVLSMFYSRNIDLIDILTSEVPSGKEGIDGTRWYMPKDYHGIIGLEQLKKLDKFNEARIKNGNLLLELLKGAPGISLCSKALPGEDIYTTFVIRVKNRNDFRRKIFRLGIDTHSGNMFAGSKLPGFKGRGKCEFAEDAVKHMVHIPIYPYLTDNNIRVIANAIIEMVS